MQAAVKSSRQHAEYGAMARMRAAQGVCGRTVTGPGLLCVTLECTPVCTVMYGAILHMRAAQYKLNYMNNMYYMAQWRV